MTRPTILIMGGEEKGNDYNQISDLIKKHVKSIICLGVDNSKIMHFFNEYQIPLLSTDNIQDAVNESKIHAKNGDTVLFSPACKSFDLFQNYVDRGNQFKSLVEKI
jgi:UDP-N-acetylmuramoylalanine--D-glutamate ligase